MKRRFPVIAQVAKRKLSATSKWGVLKLAISSDPRLRDVARRAEQLFKDFLKELAEQKKVFQIGSHCPAL
eukprot:1176202-Prorocentrum_minimum.AAC.1